MIKYEVVKDSSVEITSHDRIPRYTTAELCNYADSRSAQYYDLIASTESKKRAQKIFDKEKHYCNTVRFRGFGSIRGVRFDVLKLVENEYDEDGEFVQEIGTWDIYIEPMTV